MAKKILLTLITITICGLCGCINVQEGVEQLPPQPEPEVSHNESSGMEIGLPDVKIHELDQNFTDKYIDTDSYEKGKKSAVNGVKNTKEDYEETEKKTIQTQNEINSKYNEISNSAETNMGDIKKEAEQKINDAVESKSSEIEESKKKSTTEAAVNETEK